MHKTAKRWYFVSKIYRTRPNFTKQLQISHKRRKNKQFSRNFLLSCHFSTPVSITFCQFKSTQKIFHLLYQYFGGNLSYLFVYFCAFKHSAYVYCGFFEKYYRLLLSFGSWVRERLLLGKIVRSSSVWSLFFKKFSTNIRINFENTNVTITRSLKLSQMLHIFTDFFFFLPLEIVDYGNGTMEKKLMKCLVSVFQWILYF